jgi:hypothetical protein
MPQQHLDSTQIIACLQEMGGKTVAQGMNALTPFDTGFCSGFLIGLAKRLVRYACAFFGREQNIRGFNTP